MTNKFITGKELEEAIYNIIFHAEETLLIVSPFIKLGDYFKKLFNNHISNPDFHIILVFGKNESEIRKSLSQNDIEYFKTFPNISIIYVPNLHAKYYGNEKKGIITSINLYDYSFINNIEFGVYTEHKTINKILNTNNTDEDAWNTCMDIAEENEAIFIRRPVYKIKKGFLLSDILYSHSETLLDSTETLYKNHPTAKKNKKTIKDFPHEIERESNSNLPTRDIIEKEPKTQIGFCIRTGEKIKFNPKQPLSKEAWKSWNEYKNMDYKENYCHKTGKPSNGKTSMRNPILND